MAIDKIWSTPHFQEKWRQVIFRASQRLPSQRADPIEMESVPEWPPMPPHIKLDGHRY